MKPGLLLLLCCLVFKLNFATKITAIANTGMGWSVPGNWDLNRIPGNNDTAIIPAGVQMNVKGALYSLPYPNMDISIAGVLFFDPSGKLDLGIASTVQIEASGTINSTGSPSELIRINGVVKYNGDLDGLIPGPATADRFTLASPMGFIFAILPLKFELFTATPEAGKITLRCKISNDVRIDRIELERSSDGKQWSKVTDKSLNSTQTDTYLYDLHPATQSITYYRLLVFETSALISISKVVAVHASSEKNALLVHYNQQQGDIVIRSSGFRRIENLTFKLVNGMGQVIRTESLSSEAHSWSLHLNNPGHGVYYAIIEGQQHYRTAYRFIL